MNFIPERLVNARQALGINKAEAARRLNMSAMGYGRYEKGERMPSYQTLSYIAQKFDTTLEYLCGESDASGADVFLIAKTGEPELFQLIEVVRNQSPDTIQRIMEYIKMISCEK